MDELNIKPQVIEIIKDRFEKSTSCVWLGNTIHSSVNIIERLWQGFSLSPVLINIYMEYALLGW